MNRRVVTNALFLWVLSAACLHANIIITPTFDPSITADPNVSTIEGAINTAIGAYETLFTNSIDVTIYFQEGGGLGVTNVVIYSASYTSFYNGLVANNANPAAITALNANSGNANTNGGVNPVNGSSNLEVKSANLRAVGINQAAGCFLNGSAGSFGCGSDAGLGGPFDGIITLNTSLTTPGSPGSAAQYSLVSVAEHEIDEVLGLGSALLNLNASSGSPTTPFNAPAPEDLYRYDAIGSRTLTTDCASPSTANFSYGPSTGVIAAFNNACNGGDFGDWAGSGTAQVQDAFATPGSSPTLGTSEIDALTAIGYDTTVSLTPEPATFVSMVLAIGLLTCGWRRRARG